MQDEKCCAVSCNSPLDENFWNQQYKAGTTGWDLGEVSPAIMEYFDRLSSKDLRILIPGCGNAHEAAYLLESGFTDVTVIDIAPVAVENLKKKFDGEKSIRIILGDFFEHEQQYDLILEQTFFCALPPFMRQRYVAQMHRLLKDGGVLAGLLFDREFDESPPFGGSRGEYEQLFAHAFDQLTLRPTALSVEKRAGTELFFEIQKRQTVVNLYRIDGVTCGGCSEAICEKFQTLGALNCSISVDFKELLLVSDREIELSKLRELISYEPKYKIEPLL